MKNSKNKVKLPKDLSLKLDSFSNDTKNNIKISDYFSWTEFKTIFSNTTSIFPLLYKTTNFELINYGNKSVLTIDYKDSTNDIVFNYSSANDLLNSALIDGHLLKDIWEDLITNQS